MIKWLVIGLYDMTHTIHLPIIAHYQPSLKAAFGKHGIQFGFAVSAGSFQDNTTRSLIAQHANIVTTENAMKMEYIQPLKGMYDFSEADTIIDYAHDLDIDVHGHTASWSLANPDWLYKGYTRDELMSILRQHIDTFAWHYSGGELVSLDTANEGYVYELNAGVWSPLGEKYIEISFQDALYTVGCPLMYNSFFPTNDEYDKAISLLNKGWASGIGIQLHLHYNGWETMLNRTDKFLDRIRLLGAWARFSEVGVLAPEPQQSAIYAAVTQLAIKHQDIVRGVIVWGVKDPAWRGDVTLFDSGGEAKPCYHSVMDVLK